MNMLATITPKSDQLNADDLIGRTLTIKVSRVSVSPGTEQPCSINFEGDAGKPYKPGKSMRRVLVAAWGPDANAYVGRSMTLYRDESVQFGGLAVGGIRISHMSHIDDKKVMALTAMRGNKKAFTVQPLQVQNTPDAATQARQWAEEIKAKLAKVSKAETLTKWLQNESNQNHRASLRDLDITASDALEAAVRNECARLGITMSGEPVQQNAGEVTDGADDDTFFGEDTDASGTSAETV